MNEYCKYRYIAIDFCMYVLDRKIELHIELQNLNDRVSITPLNKQVELHRNGECQDPNHKVGA